MDNKNNKKDSKCIQEGLFLGIVFGICVGVATRDIWVWLPIGIALGFALGYGKSIFMGKDDSDKGSDAAEETNLSEEADALEDSSNNE